MSLPVLQDFQSDELVTWCGGRASIVGTVGIERMQRGCRGEQCWEGVDWLMSERMPSKIPEV